MTTIETVYFEGETINVIKGQPDPNFPDVPPVDFSFVLTRGNLIVGIGRVGIVQQVLTACKLKILGSGSCQLLPKPV